MTLSCDKGYGFRKADISFLLEAIGYLLPSISLAIVNTVVPDDQRDNTIRITAFSLGATGCILYLISSIDIVRAAANCKTSTNKEKKVGVWKSIKLFAVSSTLRYFIIKSMITAMGAIIGGTMSVLSKEYFGLLGTELWVGALGIPVGGIVSAAAALLIGRMSDLKRFVFSAFGLVGVFGLMLGFSQDAIPFFETQNHEVNAKCTFFAFGSVVGFFFAEVWTVSLTMWLEELKKWSFVFVSRANSLNHISTQAMNAIVFQLLFYLQCHLHLHCLYHQLQLVHH